MDQETESVGESSTGKNLKTVLSVCCSSAFIASANAFSDEWENLRDPLRLLSPALGQIIALGISYCIQRVREGHLEGRLQTYIENAGEEINKPSIEPKRKRMMEQRRTELEEQLHQMRMKSTKIEEI